MNERPASAVSEDTLSWPDLSAVMEDSARARAGVTALRYLQRGERVADTATFGELHRSALTIARQLLSIDLAGRPVFLALPQGLDFVRCFLGCLYAGVVAVPVPALGDPRGAARLLAIARHADPIAVIAPSDRKTSTSWCALGQVCTAQFLSPDALSTGEPLESPRLLDADEIAFLQYTSGSTSRPKGVVVTRGNIAANLAMIRNAFRQEPTDSIVSWLPLHHDMGLIGAVLMPLSLGATATLMSPLAFVQKPIRWLRALDRFGATTAGAPNFAYDLCVRAVDEDAAGSIDLSRWKLAFCGSEPVREATLSRFAARFRVSGFDARAFYPCYGLAEATLFVTGGVPLRGLVTAERRRNSSGEARIVSCGCPRLGASVEILDPARDHIAKPGAVGEIAVAGPQLSPGFWSRPGEIVSDSEREVRIDGRRYLRTGDLGEIRDGSLFVVGRSKNMIIVRGANIYAEDVEDTVMQLPAANEFGAVAALSMTETSDQPQNDEGVILVCELDRRNTFGGQAVLSQIARSVAQDHGFLPLDILVVPAGSIDRTVSGKLQRDATRTRYCAGALPTVSRYAPPGVGKTPPRCS